jgi:phosphotransacetylase/acyl dehydratase
MTIIEDDEATTLGIHPDVDKAEESDDEAPRLRNVTYDEIRVGEEANVIRTVTADDLQLFAVVSGNVNPRHIDEAFAREQGDGRLVAPAMLGAAAISAVLGNRLPGPGTIYRRQDIRFERPLYVGDQLKIYLQVTEKKPHNVVELNCLGVNQDGERIFFGVAEVVAPDKSVEVTATALPDVQLIRHAKFRDLIARCRQMVPVRTAVAHPCDESAITAVVEAARDGLIAPILVGPRKKIEAAAASAGVDCTGFELVEAAYSHEAAAAAVDLVKRGEAEMLMKGSLHTDELMAAVVAREAGLRTARRISHCFVMDLPTYDELLIVTDAAINITPTLEEKVDIVQNAIDLALALGVAPVRVAVLSAVETINARMPSTLEAAALCKMADRGQIQGAQIDGPLALDNAINLHAARLKKIDSPVAGRANILLVPDLNAGNMLAKSLSFLADADAAGIVLGARVPIVLTSRADSVEAKQTSCAVGVLVAAAQREGTWARMVS